MAYDKKAEQKRIMRRNEKIRDEYIRLTEIKALGVRKYSDEYVMKKLSEDFYLSVRTIEGILGYKYENLLQRREQEAAGDPNQLSLLDQIEDDEERS